MSEAHKNLKLFNLCRWHFKLHKTQLNDSNELVDGTAHLRFIRIVYAWQFVFICFTLTLTFFFLFFRDTQMLSIVFARFRMQHRQLMLVLHLRHISLFKAANRLSRATIGDWNLTFLFEHVKDCLINLTVNLK